MAAIVETILLIQRKINFCNLKMEFYVGLMETLSLFVFVLFVCIILL